jgi:parallel beta-helix repeat protein
MLYIMLSITLVRFTFDVKPVMAQSTIYIRADGSIEPGTAPIVTLDNVTYSFNASVFEPVVVERSDIVVDVAGFTIQGTGGGIGLSLAGVSNVTVGNATVRSFYYGIRFNATSLSGVYGCNVTSNSYDGVYFMGSWGNTIFGSNLTANGNDGIKLLYASNYNVIAENVVTANNDDGIQIGDSVGNTLTENVVLANNDIGLYLNNSSDSNVDGNVVWNNRHGVELASSPYSSLSGNEIVANGWSGIELSSSDQSSIVGNNVTDDYDGVYVYECSGVDICRNNITANVEYGLWLESSSENTVFENHIYDSGVGLYLYRASSSNVIRKNCFEANDDGVLISGSSTSDNVFSENMIVANQNGVRLVFSSSSNEFYHNNFVENVQQASPTATNSWDDGLEGNFWSDYTGADLNNDGIGDTQRVLATGNIDRFPLMGMFQSFNTSLNELVNVICNSTVDDFSFVKSPTDIAITMHVSNKTSMQTVGFCRVTIPHLLMTEPYNVTVNAAPPHFANFSIYENGTHRWIYFNYGHSTLEVIIHGTDMIPPTVTILSPENATYVVSDVPLTFTINETASWMGYSLDGQANVTITGNTTLTSLSEGVHSIVVSANDTAGNMGTSGILYFTTDTTPPHLTILSPQNVTYDTDAIMLNFTIDDVASWMGYSLDSQANATIAGNTTLISLAEGPHNVVVYANDTLGNMGGSDTVYFTVAITPEITVLSPANSTYATSDVPLTFALSEAASWIGYSLDGQPNATITGNTTLTALAEGPHNVVVYANDTLGNMGVSSAVYFSVDTIPPSIAIISPQNMTYDTDSLALTFTLSEPASWIFYILDGQTNMTIAGNTTLVDLSDGAHHIVVYASDAVGNNASSSPVYFSVDTTPPDISAISQFPPEDAVLPEDQVVVNATVSDGLSGVSTVFLNYTTGNGTWFSEPMLPVGGDVWSATIPPFPYGTTVEYVIIAEDGMGHTITSEDLSYRLEYDVIPEFGSVAALLVLLVAMLVAVALRSKGKFVE